MSALKFVLILAFASVVSAASLISISGTASTEDSTFFSVGYSFAPTSDIWITDLGVLDFGNDGLPGDQRVGVFDEVGNLLTSVILPAGTTAPAGQFFVYAGVAPVRLQSGNTYVIATQGVGFPGETFTFSDAATVPGFATDSHISYIASRYANVSPGDPFTFPDQTFANNGYFGPNAIFQLTAPVPEPSTIALLGSGLLGFLLIKRKLSS